MRIPIFYCFLFSIQMIFGFQAEGLGQIHSSNENYRLVKDEDNIKVYQKAAPKKGYIEYKATTILNDTNMEKVILFFMDYANHAEWVYNCIQSKMWQKKDQTYLYQVCKSPWPFKDRDLCLLVKKTKLNTNSTIVEFISKPEATPAYNKKIRINDFESRWLVRQLKNKVSITVHASFDPKLALGSFVLKSYGTKIPFETLKNLKTVYNLKM